MLKTLARIAVENSALASKSKRSDVHISGKYRFGDYLANRRRLLLSLLDIASEQRGRIFVSLSTTELLLDGNLYRDNEDDYVFKWPNYSL